MVKSQGFRILLLEQYVSLMTFVQQMNPRRAVFVVQRRVGGESRPKSCAPIVIYTLNSSPNFRPMFVLPCRFDLELIHRKRRPTPTSRRLANHVAWKLIVQHVSPHGSSGAMKFSNDYLVAETGSGNICTGLILSEWQPWRSRKPLPSLS
jgi:hypothetical protein